MRHLLFYTLSCICFLFALFAGRGLCPPARASSPPVPPAKEKALESLERRIEEEKSRQKDYAARQKDLEKTLSNIRDDARKLAAEIRENENRLTGIEIRLSANEAEAEKLERIVREDRVKSAKILSALIDMRKMPPEALLTSPGSPLETAQSAMMLKDVLPDIHEHARKLGEDIARLRDLRDSLAGDRRLAANSLAALEAKQKSMTILLKERQSLYAKTKVQAGESLKKIESWSRQAKSLGELMAKIEQDKKREETRALVSSAHSGIAGKPEEPPRNPKTVISSPGGGGDSVMPVSGTIRVGYGQTDNIGASSRGLTLESRPNALILAPMDGIIRFGGFFKRYGQLIIIEHGGGYHSLLAGLGKIDAAVGQQVSAGDPLGTLAEDKTAPSLYFELRRNGHPVDPSVKFAGLI